MEIKLNQFDRKKNATSRHENLFSVFDSSLFIHISNEKAFIFKESESFFSPTLSLTAS